MGLWPVYLPEIPLRLSLTLNRVTLDTEVMARFTCTLSRPDMRVSWYREEEKLLSSPKYELLHEGRMHRLMVHDLCPDDYADYLVVIGSRRLTGTSLREGLSLSHISALISMELSGNQHNIIGIVIFKCRALMKAMSKIKVFVNCSYKEYSKL